MLDAAGVVDVLDEVLLDADESLFDELLALSPLDDVEELEVLEDLPRLSVL